jgi:serine protease AprX
MTGKGLSWDHKTGKGTSLLAALAMIAALLPMAATPSVAADDTPVEVIVRELTPLTDTAETLVQTIGGAVLENLEIIGGFTATVPASMVDTLATDPSVSAVTPNAALRLSAAGWEDASALNTSVAEGDSSSLKQLATVSYPGSLYEVTGYVNARDAWSAGYTGNGVDVALIDSGVLPVNGLTAPGKVVNGPDLSFESQNPDFQYLDTSGHGTHLAGIIAGRDDEVSGPYANASSDFFVGIAPDARIVSIKVADKDGATDVSQVIAAIDWVIQNKNANGMNIRVINLAFGTDSTQSYILDPLAYAAEQAWHAGIVVVVAAGNDGNNNALRNPAIDPYVIAVGAVDHAGTDSSTDDFIADFSNCGTTARHVDVVAPGRSITSLRAPGSTADLDHPEAVVADRLFLGSGTSQASAVVSGVVALVLDAQPGLSPDDVKAMLMGNAATLGGSTSPECEGGGSINALSTTGAKAPTGRNGSSQAHTPSTGLGALEGARGTDHLEHDGVVLDGERDIMGNPWNGFYETVTVCETVGKGKNATTVCGDELVALDTLWDGGAWNGTSWSGTSWSGTSWSGLSWSGTSWSGTSWSGLSWSGTSWSSMVWNGTSWSGLSWSGTSWSGTSWSGLSWSGLRWD